jgi:hypothetical protein
MRKPYGMTKACGIFLLLWTASAVVLPAQFTELSGFNADCRVLTADC